MLTYKVKDFKDGWILGDFNPSIKKVPFEVGIHTYPKGHKSDGHYHKFSTEINVIMSGEVLIYGDKYRDGDIFVYKPEEKSFVEFTQDTTLIVIKTNSVMGDKWT